MPAFFGLDIGSTTIKVVELEKVNDRFKLLAAGMIPAPPKGLASEATVDQQAVAENLKKLLADCKITIKFVNTALPESQIFTRVLQMPPLSDNELASAISWEAEQAIPLPLSEVSLDFQVLERPPKKAAPGEKMDVLLVAAPRVLIDKYLKVLEMAGLTPLSLETEVIAIARALGSQDPNIPTTLIINIGALTTDLTVVRQGVISFTRSISTGGRALARAVASSLGIEERVAEEYKKTYGLEEGQLEGKILEAIKPIFEVVTSEIQRAISFYLEKHREDPIKRVVVSGGTAKLPGLALHLAETLGLEVQAADPWQNVEKDEKLLPELLENGPIFATAAGLAMKEF